jgi:hypothetical protein
LKCKYERNGFLKTGNSDISGLDSTITDADYQRVCPDVLPLANLEGHDLHSDGSFERDATLAV